MKSNFGKMILGLAVLPALAGCAQKQARVERVEQKVSSETQINKPADLRAETDQTIQNAPNLTPEQKSQLMSLKDQARDKARDLQSEGLRLRSVLLKDLLAENYDRKEVNLVKRKLEKNEKERLALFFDSVEKANKIMGREAANHQDYFDDLMLAPNEELREGIR